MKLNQSSKQCQFKSKYTVNGVSVQREMTNKKQKWNESILKCHIYFYSENNMWNSQLEN